jgi:hypothetical protein
MNSISKSCRSPCGESSFSSLCSFRIKTEDKGSIKSNWRLIYDPANAVDSVVYAVSAVDPVDEALVTSLPYRYR